MKVLIVASSDIIGGAHKAAYRLHKALLTHNIDSQMLVHIQILFSIYNNKESKSGVLKYLINGHRQYGTKNMSS